jgi:mono/diheme cytochrome c family protein
LKGSALVDGAIDRIEIDGQSALRDFDMALRRYDARGAQQVAVLAPTRANLHARGADGNAIEQIEIRWANGKGTTSLMVVDDFAPVVAAIDSLANDNLDGKFDGFSDAAFRRARLLPALLSALGVAGVDACCLDASNLPPPQTSPIGEHGTGAPAHARFNQYCGQCHLSAERAPPNFLAGDTAVVEATLRHCAPRIFVRLSMWQSSPDVRAKTPMPPDVALHRMEVSADAWRDGEPLAALLQSTRERLRAETGRSPDLDGLLRDGYETLRACLPD